MQCPALFEGIEALSITLKDKLVKIAMVTGKGRQSTDIYLEQFCVGKYIELSKPGYGQEPGKRKEYKTS